MITGMHAIIYRRDAAADRAFFRDVLGFPSRRCGRRIADLRRGHRRSSPYVPPSENSKHGTLRAVRDDVKAEADQMGKKGMESSPITDEGSGGRRLDPPARRRPSRPL